MGLLAALLQIDAVRSEQLAELLALTTRETGGLLGGAARGATVALHVRVGTGTERAVT